MIRTKRKDSKTTLVSDRTELLNMTDDCLQQMRRCHWGQHLRYRMVDLGHILTPPRLANRGDPISLYARPTSPCHGIHQRPEECHNHHTSKIYLHTHFSELWNSGPRLTIYDNNLVSQAFIIGSKRRQSHHMPEVTITTLLYPLRQRLQTTKMMKVPTERVILGKDR